MEQGMRFGLDLGWLALLKKETFAQPIRSNFRGRFFKFSWAKTKIDK